MKKPFRVLLLIALCCVAAAAIGLAILNWLLNPSLSGTYASDQTTITGKPKRTITFISDHSLRDVRPGLLVTNDNTYGYHIEGKKLTVYQGEGFGSEGVRTESLTIADDSHDSLVTYDGMVLRRKRK